MFLEPNDQVASSRLRDFEEWIKNFSALENFAGKIKPTENAALLLNQFYWNVVQAYIRPLLGKADQQEDDGKHHLINRFKIISITELTIMAVLPFDVIVHEKGSSDEKVNAQFAWYCAIAILRGWDGEFSDRDLNTVIQYKEILNPGEAEEMRAEFNFRKEHIQYLTTLDTSIQLPVLSNAQTWRMLYFCLLALSQKLS